MERIILIDGNSLMYRAYFGTITAKAMTNSKGLYTNATYSFARMINSLLEKNDYAGILVAFDAGKKTFRHDIMEGYKDGRSPMPPEMREQIAYIKEFLDLKRIKRYELSLYEADDIIGTMAKRAEEAGYRVDIYSSDKDLLQLITENTTVHLTKKGMTELEDFNTNYFAEVYGIKVESFVDLKALMGDKSDAIPGVPGIGEKKALKYLKEYENLENLLQNIANIKGADQKKFEEYQDQARLCKRMATICRDCPVEIELSDILRVEPDNEALIKFYQELEFKSFLVNEAPKKLEINYEVIDSEQRLKETLQPNSYIILENSNYNYHKNPVLAVGIVNERGNFIVTPNYFNSPSFKEFMEADNSKNLYDYKRTYVSLRHFGIQTKGVSFDLLLGAYIANSKITKGEFKFVSDYFNYHDTFYDEEIYGKGAKRMVPSDISRVYNHIISKCLAIKAIKPEVISFLTETKQLSLLLDIEIPLSYTLGKMEYAGMSVDLLELERQDNELSQKISLLEQDIYQLAGQKFNISSPKQLAKVLFEDLAIKYPGNPKKGYSTEVSILEAIKAENPIVEDIMSYRQLTKLYGTYIKGLREQIFADNKVHTIFEQALTETGRLSSVEPNLQNIPIRTPQGSLIRKLFIPSGDSYNLYSADYSQIELRVLASMAHVKHLEEAFNNDEDVHTKTAQAVFKKEDITPLERRKAKAVNFGIVYGISAFGLANDIEVSQKEAKEFIDDYLALNPEIKIFMDETVEACKRDGYVTTIKGRRRYIPEINSKNYMEREFGKRQAMNAPIQGSAADIIKMAMIALDKALEEENLKSRILVQVHDELVLEVKDDERDAVMALVKDKMLNVIKLSVPLSIGTGSGNNWYELK